jgi:mono/diheme cytochrome c family protein
VRAKRVKLSIGTTYITVGICVVLGSIVACHKRSHPDEAAAPAASAAYAIRPLTDVVFERTQKRLERGKYLVDGLLQCFNCHTDRDWTRPGAPPLKGREGSGHVWRDDGEFRLVAPNITPDKETGAGTWTDDMLARSIREGISHDGRMLHPQMWYGSFRSLSDEDLASVIVYLRSIKAMHNPLPKTKLKIERQPNQEPLTEAVFQPDMSDPVKRGGYLVRVADCVGCHTAFEAPLNPGFFGGGNLIELGKEKAFSGNVTFDPSGISYYDEALFIEVLRTGRVKARKLSSIMPWVVFRNLNDEDMKSIFAYLRTRRPVHHSVDNAEAATACAMCGQKHGFGDRNHPKIEQRVEVDPASFAACVGEYRFEDGFVIAISTDGNKLFIGFPGNDSKLELVPISATEFTANEIPDVISFSKDDRGRVTHLISNVDDVAPRIK